MEWKKKYRRETGKREIEVERRQETEVYLNAKKEAFRRKYEETAVCEKTYKGKRGISI